MAPAEPAGEDGRDTPARSGVRRLLGAGAEALRTRLDLAAVELELFLRALVRVLACAVGALVCGLLATVFAVVAVVAALWDTHRTLALVGGSGLFALLGATLGYLGVRTLQSQPGFLEGTLEQLRRDRGRPGRSS